MAYGGRVPKEGSFGLWARQKLAPWYKRGLVRFVGHLPVKSYARLLKSSHVHCYLTRPFVASWNLLDAMSSGCCLVASDLELVRESLIPVLQPGWTIVRVGACQFRRSAQSLSIRTRCPRKLTETADHLGLEPSIVSPDLAGSVGDLTHTTLKSVATTALSPYPLPVSFRGLCPSSEFHGLLRHSFSRASSHSWRR